MIFDDFNGEIFEDTCNDWRYDEDDADGTEMRITDEKLRSRTIFRKSTTSSVKNSTIKYFIPSTRGKKMI